MREIKFRAWDGTKMHYNFVVARPQSANVLGILLDEEFAKTQYGLPMWKVMQYTNLKDKNGKEIYEGDIVISDIYTYVTDDFYGYVEKTLVANYEYVDTNVQTFVLKFMEIKENGDRCFYNAGRTITIIGNIYENPELLKK